MDIPIGIPLVSADVQTDGIKGYDTVRAEERSMIQGFFCIVQNIRFLVIDCRISSNTDGYGFRSQVRKIFLNILANLEASGGRLV